MANNLALLIVSLLAFALSSLVTAEPVHSFAKRRPLPPLPNNDQWYGAPGNLTDYQSGDIIKWRDSPAPISLNNTPGTGWNLARHLQIQYRTQNSVGAPIANVVTVLIPYNAKFDHLYAYAYFSDASDPRHNPSIAMTLGPPEDAIFTKQQLAAITPALNQGWIVSVADDGGPQASFPAGPCMAFTTLDSIRAMKRSGLITGLSNDPFTTLNGYSGGGMTAAWTGELHGIYAPELRIDGIALGGLIPDIPFLFNYIKNGTGYFAWGPQMFSGLSHDYRELSTWLDENLAEEFADIFWATETYNIDQNRLRYENISTCAFFKGGCNALNDPMVSDILYTATVNGQHGTPIAPWYLYSTAADEVSPIFLTDNLVTKYCNQGASIMYERSVLNLPHARNSISGFAGAFNWMSERHAGRPIPYQGCQRSVFSPYSRRAIWPLPLLSYYNQVMAAGRGGPIGPRQ